MIEVLTATALATVQDLGRTGALQWGVGTSGAMDRLALAAGNIMLGNAQNAAGIEVQVFPFRVRFETACAFVVTGADCAARLDDEPVLPWWVHTASAGQCLRLDVPQSGAWRASRAYVCVAGGIDVPEVLGSRSTQLRGAFGGHDGRALRQGDRLPVGISASALGPSDFGIVPPAVSMPLTVDGLTAIRVLPASEYERFTAKSRETFWSSAWKITPHADRYGYRFAGPTLTPIAPMELRSHGIVPGVIQVPHGGQPIVQMRDAQPSGGYPKIATVIDADLWRLGQAPIGSQIQFVETTWSAAVAALDQVDGWLADITRGVRMQRERSGSNRG
jgi:5-oxoprolinase (ATP-hydrolysing) subunit C